jgi:hypothetical protein
MKPSHRFLTVSLDEGLIVARRDGDRLFVMNGSARFMWEKRVEGIPDAEIPPLTATHYGIEVEQARDDFGKTLRLWQAEGLVEPSGNCRHYSIGGALFSLHYANAALESAITPIFAHLEHVPGGATGQSPTEFELAIEDAQFVLRAGGIETLRSGDLDAIIDKLTFTIVTLAWDSIKALVSIHAAAVGTGGQCVLVPAPSGSGKSTLTAALLASERLSYLSDDIAPLEDGSLRAVPVPGTVILKSGSWEALKSLLPKLLDLPVHRRRGDDVRYWSPPAIQVAADPMPIRAIVFAHYEAASKAHLKRLLPLEGLSRLIAAPCTISAPITSDKVHRVAEWARAIPFYALPYGSLADATQIVEDLLES